MIHPVYENNVRNINYVTSYKNIYSLLISLSISISLSLSLSLSLSKLHFSQITLFVWSDTR